MNFLLHHITCGVIHQPMPLYQAFTLKSGGRNINDKVAATAGSTGVTGVFGAFIDDLEGYRHWRSFVMRCSLIRAAPS